MDHVRSINPVLNSRGKRPEENRRSGRIRVSALESDFGPVTDLSAGGGCVLTRRKWARGEVREIVLIGKSLGVRVKARCAWVKPAGLFRRLIGLEFVFEGPDEEEQRAGVAALALNHSDGEGRAAA